MEIVFGVIGFFAGLFLWSNIFGSIFATLPVEKQMVKAGAIPSVRWTKVIVPIIFAVIILALTAILAKPFFFGSLIAAFILIFNIGKLRNEALQNFKEEMERVAPKGA